jgi:hypothetical protein
MFSAILVFPRGLSAAASGILPFTAQVGDLLMTSDTYMHKVKNVNHA